MLERLREKVGYVKSTGDKDDYEGKNHAHDSDDVGDRNETFHAEIFAGTCVDELGFHQ